MANFIPWNSQPLEEWAKKYARGKFVELDGLSTHYLEKGSGEPVILIHGFFFDTNMWNKSINVLAEKYKVYAIDLWGFGYSTRKPLDYGYPLYAQQLRLFMDAMNIQKASLIGQSMGGGTIIKFAISNRHRVEKIVLVNAAGMPNELPIMGRISNLPTLGELMYRMNSDFVRKFTLGSTFLYNKKLITDEFYEQLTRFHKIERSSEVMLYITRKQFFDTLTEEIKVLGSMDIPILIVWGREEKSIQLSIGEELARTLKGSRLEILNQAGHCSNIDQYRQFNELVLDFLASGSNAS
jgi:pimeloyl-ACP methyl ester carboxylesterase